MQLKPNALLQGGKYKIERVLGQGGFGITYQAVQVALNRKVAIKEFFMKEYCNRDSETSQVSVPSEGSKELVQKHKAKFLKEAQMIAGLDHEHIIRIYDIFEEHDTAYYVMEYHSGGSLSDKVQSQGMLSEDEALKYIYRIADALKYIHEQNLNHLDVKPGNILLTSRQKVILIDFGLSKRYDEEGNQTSTTPVGISHGYAPMEQYKKGGVGTFSPATDIYSLGATLYKLITGNTPPEASEVMEEGLPALPANVSAPIVKAIDSAMQPRKKDRPQSIDEFLGMLVGVQGSESLGRERAVEVENTEIAVEEDIASGKKQEAEETVVYSDSSIQSKETNRINGHEYVDLGLSVKWATCNIGAEKPEDYGDYFAWGETTPKSDYCEETYEHCVKNFFFSRYVDLGKNISDSEYDVARVNWGGSWRMPIRTELEELKDKCTWKWTTQDGHDGYKVTGPNGNSIFLPAAAACYGTEIGNRGSYGDYWSATLGEGGSGRAYNFYFRNGHWDWNNDYRYYGRTIRPVTDIEA